MKNNILLVLPEDTLYAPLYVDKIISHFRKKKISGKISVCCWNPTYCTSLRQLLLKRFKLYGPTQFFIFLELMLASKCYAQLEKYLSFSRTFNIRNFCKRNCIPYSKTDSVNSSHFVKYIRDNNITLLISIAIGEKFSQQTLAHIEYPLNVHSSILPRYRGVMGLFWAHLNNDDKAGVSVHKMVMNFDAGPIFGQCEFPITEQDSLHQLYLKAIKNGSKLVCEVVESIVNNKARELLPDIPKDSYRSFPQPADTRRYTNLGKKFFNLRDLRINQI